MKSELFSKIDKLLSLARNSPYKSEAHSALLKAKELLAENPEYTQASKSDPILHEPIARSEVEAWEANLSALISKNNRCFIVLKQDGPRFRGPIIVLGRQRDVELSIKLIKFSVAQAVILFQSYLKANSIPILDEGEFHDIRLDYLNGFVQGLEDKYLEQSKEKSLMVLPDKELISTIEQAQGAPIKELSLSVSKSNHETQGYIDGKRGTVRIHEDKSSNT